MAIERGDACTFAENDGAIDIAVSSFMPARGFSRKSERALSCLSRRANPRRAMASARAIRN